MSASLLRRTTRLLQSHSSLSLRSISTLPNNSHIYVHPSSDHKPSTNFLSLLPSSPPNPSLAIGTSSSIPPTPESLQENANFLSILHSVLRDNATSDPLVQSQAQAYASTAGSSLGSGGVFFPQQQQRQPKRSSKVSGSRGPGYGGGGGAGGGGAGGASAQGGAGGGGVGGYIHVSDMRNPPDYGRIAWPEDIFGSLEVDGEGKFVDGNGRYQESGTYRICTREGILGLSPYLRERLVARLKELEKATQ